jgi:hypothetical protein
MYATVPTVDPGLVNIAVSSAVGIVDRLSSPETSFTKSKIENLGVSHLGDEDVRWLDIAVNDSRGMGRGEGIRDLNA